MTAYYNEFDPFAAAWLTKLIAAGHIAPGVVDTRSIEDVTPNDLAGFTQCHFFAGIGVWSHALRLAGWSDNRAIWTGSCPCQPFSAAGKGGGFDDERHLWPAFHYLIEQCGPSVVIEEQVASKDGLAWLDLVSADMEGSGYAFGAADLCVAGFGGPHIRQRSYWVADRDNSRLEGRLLLPERADQCAARSSSVADGMDDAASSRHESAGSGQSREPERGRSVSSLGRASGGLADDDDDGRGTGRDDHGSNDRDELNASGELSSSRLGNADDSAEPQEREGNDRINEQRAEEWRRQLIAAGVGTGSGICGGSHFAGSDGERSRSGVFRMERPGPTNGHWRDADWLGCRDGKWRPVEPGTFPLAHGATNRVGRLRGYGNAIAAPVAQGFIETVMRCL